MLPIQGIDLQRWLLLLLMFLCPWVILLVLRRVFFSPPPQQGFLARFLVSGPLKQAVIQLEDKSSKFPSLQDNILAHKSVLLKNLQNFWGKPISFFLLVPAAKLL